MTAATPDAHQSNTLREAQDLLAAGRQDAATEFLQAALTEQPRQAIAHLWLGALLSQQGQSLMAAEHFHRCFSLNPELEKLPSTANAPAQMTKSVHLALIVPDDCSLRCGPETRGWSEGQCIIFDDSFEHEAWNRSDGLRAVLILETWNPHLSETEKTALTLLCNAISDWEQPVLEKWLGPAGA